MCLAVSIQSGTLEPTFAGDGQGRISHTPASSVCKPLMGLGVDLDPEKLRALRI